MEYYICHYYSPNIHLLFEFLDFGGRQSVGFSNHWNDVNFVMQRSHQLHVNWFQSATDSGQHEKPTVNRHRDKTILWLCTILLSYLVTVGFSMQLNTIQVAWRQSSQPISCLVQITEPFQPITWLILTKNQT